MIDIASEVDAVRRMVGGRATPTGEDRTVHLQRSFAVPVVDVWAACTEPARIGSWFLPVTGDLRVGGKYQLVGNAGGEILRCQPPRLLSLSWVFGESTTGLELRLSEDAAGGTVLDLEHSVALDEHWAEFGPGAVGVGWDMAVLSLSRYLRGRPVPDPVSWPTSAEARDFVTRAAGAWGAAHEVSGAPTGDATAAAARTRAAYAP
ncbi:SRPBCC family protein [Longispora sp. K20-0274]|uniref:SRPBCC family protein n=1 Tax=Longispora sp. K20-0274 TaxID=3088255 RepID=UPI00399B24A6